MDYQHKIEVYAAMVELSDQMLAAAMAEDWDGMAEIAPLCQAHITQLQFYDNVLPLSSETRTLNLQSMLRIQANYEALRNLVVGRMQTLNLLISSCGNEQKLAQKYAV